MMSSTGLTSKLATEEDLLQKMRHDLKRMDDRPDDVYAAFDFFVTAEHLPEWANDTDLKKSNSLLQVVSHLANGAKHFHATAKHHQSVARVTHHEGAFDPAVFDHEAFDVGGISITLKVAHAAEFGPEIGALELAKMVLSFWEDRLPKIQNPQQP